MAAEEQTTAQSAIRGTTLSEIKTLTFSYTFKHTNYKVNRDTGYSPREIDY